MQNRKVQMFTRYSELGASSRHRFYNYVSGLNLAGYEVKVSPFFDDGYLRRLYAGKKPNPSTIMAAYARRLASLLHAEKHLLIEYELLPFVPWTAELLFLRNKRYILNFDDNVWEKYSHSGILSGKFDALTLAADGVIVANSFLEAKASQLNRNVIQIPTALDPEPYRRNQPKFERFTVVWIGTPVTYKYLEPLAPVLRELSGKIDFELLVIARKNLENRTFEGVRMRFEDWSEELETALIGRAHVGIMPLPEEAFAQGKSAFKLLQYFAAGLPAVASPVGENRHVVESGRNGFLAATEADWIARLEQLYYDSVLRNSLAVAAGVDAEKYSLHAWIPRMVSFMEKVWR